MKKDARKDLEWNKLTRTMKIVKNLGRKNKKKEEKEEANKAKRM